MKPKNRCGINKSYLILLLIIMSIIKTSIAQFNNKSFNCNTKIQNINVDENNHLIYSNFFSCNNYLNIYKNDSLNNNIWKKQVAFTDTITEPSANIIKVFENNIFILTSYSYAASASYFLLTKLDSNGTLLWCKKITGAGVNSTNHCMSITKQKNIYIEFRNCSYENSFLKLDSLGNYLWSKSYKISNFRGAVQTFKETENDGLIILSTFLDTPFTQTKIMLYQVDSSGNIVWNKIYDLPPGTDGRALFTNLLRDLQGNYYFAINLQGNNRNTIIVKTDSLGNLIWSKIYQYPNLSEISVIKQIDLDSKGNLYVVGLGCSSSLLSVIMKINASDGHVENAWGGILNIDPVFEPSDAKCLNDNRIVLGGFGNNEVGGTLVAMDSLGNGICGFYPITITESSYTIYNTTNETFLFPQSLIITDTTFIVQPSIINSNTYCAPIAVSEIINDNFISFFPNPSGGIININSPDHIVRIEILDLLGNIVYKSSGLNGQINLSGKSNGIYIIRMVTDDNINKTDKIIIDH